METKFHLSEDVLVVEYNDSPEAKIQDFFAAVEQHNVIGTKKILLNLNRLAVINRDGLQRLVGKIALLNEKYKVFVCCPNTQQIKLLVDLVRGVFAETKFHDTEEEALYQFRKLT